MIYIIAESYIKPECREQFLALAKEMIRATRNEPGNISYTLTEDLNEPNHFTYLEEWQDEDAIKAHNASAHFTTIVPQTRAMAQKPGSVKLYQKVSETE